jgi:hypothetical protein
MCRLARPSVPSSHGVIRTCSGRTESVTLSPTVSAASDSTSTSAIAVEILHLPDSGDDSTTPSRKFEIPMKSATKCDAGRS